MVTAIVPAGLHTNLYTDRWNGSLRSPLLPETHKYISLRLMGGRLASRRTVLDNCAIGEGYKTLENDSPNWLRLDTIAGEKLPAFVEVITKFDNPRIPDRPGMLKEKPEELASPHSYFGAIAAVLHDTPETPREELSHLARLFEGPTPNSLDELAARYRTIVKQALAAKTDGDVRWVDSFLQHGLLSNNRNASPKLAELSLLIAISKPAPRPAYGRWYGRRRAWLRHAHSHHRRSPFTGRDRPAPLPQPHRPDDAAQHDWQRPPRARRDHCQPNQPAHCPRDRQPRLALHVRARAGRNSRQLRPRG